MSIKYLEPHLVARIEAAEQKARDLIEGRGNDEDALEGVLRWRLCLHYGQPFFWTYLDDKTIDDMIFELELIKLSKKNNVERGSEMLQTAPKEEQDKLFEDWDTVAPPTKTLEDDLKFMQTGEFKK
jgi:hypothetical protein